MQSSEQPLQLIDIYAMWHVPFWQQWWFMPVVVAGTLSLAAIIACVVYYLRKKEPVMPVWLHVLQQLKLLALMAGDQTCGDQFYVRITTLLKFYLSDYFGQDIASFTDQQVVDFVQQATITDEQKKIIERIFYGGQQVKFAQGASLVAQMQQDLEQALQLVEQLHLHRTLTTTSKHT